MGTYQNSCNACHVLLPSGELTFCHGKSPFLMGKSTISMAIYECVYAVSLCIEINFDIPLIALDYS